MTLTNSAAPVLTTLISDLGVSYAATNACKVLQGQMFRMTLSKPKNGNAQHLRVSSVVPLSSSYRPTIETLREMYGVSIGS